MIGLFIFIPRTQLSWKTFTSLLRRLTTVKKTQPSQTRPHHWNRIDDQMEETHKTTTTQTRRDFLSHGTKCGPHSNPPLPCDPQGFCDPQWPQLEFELLDTLRDC